MSRCNDCIWIGPGDDGAAWSVCRRMLDASNAGLTLLEDSDLRLTMDRLSAT